MINICYTADSAYAMQVAVSMISMLDNNKDSDLEFYILGDGYSYDLVQKFVEIEKSYKTNIHLIDVTEKIKMLNDTTLADEPGIMRNNIISFMFARLFVGSCLPETIDKLIYIDSDTLYVGDIKELYDTDIESGYIFYAVRDLWPNSYNNVIGFAEEELYFQSGILLINLKKWRECRCEDQIMNAARSANHYYYMHDMDLLNVCFRGKIGTLSPKYGMIYLLRKYTADQCLWFSGKDEKKYYSVEEINEAKNDVHVIHYAGDYFGRPWCFPKACSDNRKWLHYYNMSPWKDEPVGNKHSVKEWCKYFVKKILEPFDANLWLKRTKKRFESDNRKMLSMMGE